jgi:bacterioferritin-associated ferredoxin
MIRSVGMWNLDHIQVQVATISHKTLAKVITAHCGSCADSLQLSTSSFPPLVTLRLPLEAIAKAAQQDVHGLSTLQPQMGCAADENY